MGNEVTKQFIPTASVGLNLLLGGGISKGHQTTIWGNESAGKSAFCLETIGNNQKAGLTAGYMDVEKTFDPEWAERLGVNTSELLLGHKANIGDATDLIIKWVHAGVDIVVIDSTSAMMPKSFYEKDGSIKNFENTGQIGQQARELGAMCRMIQGENFDQTAIVFISQVRMDLGGFIPGQKPSGGKEVGHADHLRVKLTSSTSDNKALKGTVQRGDMLVEETIGRKVAWQISKNKINGRYGVGEYDLITQGDSVGLNVGAELRDYGVLYGIIEKVGNSRFIINGESIHGKDKAAAYIHNTPEIAEFLASEIETKLTVSTEPVEAEDND